MYTYIYRYHACSHMGGGSDPCKAMLPICSITHLDPVLKRWMGPSSPALVKGFLRPGGKTDPGVMGLDGLTSISS